MVTDCCDPTPYRRFFNSREAERNVRRYRRRGLDSMASSVVRYLGSVGVRGAEVLEVGGGVGAIQVELLHAGAARAINVELSSGYEDAAGRLITEEELGDRIVRELGDFVEREGEFEQADIVVMNRVVCCYPWIERLMTAAAGKAGSYLALTFPRDKWWVRSGLSLGNGFMALRRCDFRAFAHSPEAIEAVATNSGFVVRHTDHDFIWQALVLERIAS